MGRKLAILGFTLALAGVGITTCGLKDREKLSFGTTTIGYNGHEYNVVYFEEEGFNLSRYDENRELSDTIFLKYSAEDFGVRNMSEEHFRDLTGKSGLKSKREFGREIRKGLKEILGIPEGSIITNLEMYR